VRLGIFPQRRADEIFRIRADIQGVETETPGVEEPLMSLDADVLVVGAGPVGLTLAIDLAQRGISVTLVEMRASEEPPIGRTNVVSARSMEAFRRLGVAAAVREAVSCPALYGERWFRYVVANAGATAPLQSHLP
jgi:NADPH-dependent 2,4-dienoyl-CoA reductase/sulfur reductase-like enzyme